MADQKPNFEAVRRVKVALSGYNPETPYLIPSPTIDEIREMFPFDLRPGQAVLIVPTRQLYKMMLMKENPNEKDSEMIEKPVLMSPIDQDNYANITYRNLGYLIADIRYTEDKDKFLLQINDLKIGDRVLSNIYQENANGETVINEVSPKELFSQLRVLDYSGYRHSVYIVPIGDIYARIRQ